MKSIRTLTMLVTVALVGCETSGGNTDAAAMGDVRQTAIDACAKRADSLWSAAPGTSVVNQGQPDQYGNWVLKVGTGGYRSTCTVTLGGQVLGIDPG